MQRRYILPVLALALLCVVCSVAHVHAQMAEVVSSCNVITLPIGGVWRLYQDQHGNLCVPSSGGGGGSGGAATVADGADVTQGANADAAAAAGGTGTVSAKLREVTALLNSINTALAAPLPAGTNVIGGVTDTIADGANVTQGAVADAAAAAGGVGTVSAKLREVTALLNSINSGIAASIAAGTNVIGGVTASLGISNGWTPVRLSALSTTVTAVKASPGEQGMLQCYNPNATVVYIQEFNLITLSVTLGTTVPVLSIPIAPTSTGGFALSNPGINFSAAISVAATTAAANASAPSTAVDCNTVYN